MRTVPARRKGEGMIRRWGLGGFALVVALAGLFGWPAAVQAAPAEQATPDSGAIVALAGTHHLWVADGQGVLHWAGDTRALARRAVDWTNRIDVDVERLKAYRRGDPWLSAGLLKMGDSIYLPKWETDQ